MVIFLFLIFFATQILHAENQFADLSSEGIREWIVADQESGRISFEDAELLSDWIDGHEIELLRDWLSARTELSNELTTRLERWLEGHDSRSKLTDTTSSTMSSSLGSRIGVKTSLRSRQTESRIREVISARLALDRETSMQLQIEHDGGGDARIHSRTIRYAPASGVLESITLGSYQLHYGSGLVVGASRSPVRPDVDIPLGFAFPYGRGYNGIAVATRLRSFRLEMMTSVRKQSDSVDGIASGQFSLTLSSQSTVRSVVAYQFQKPDRSSWNLSSKASVSFEHSSARQTFTLEAGGIPQGGFKNPAVIGSYRWNRPGTLQPRHDLSFWWYDPDWDDLAGNAPYLPLSRRADSLDFFGKRNDRAGQFGFRYQFSARHQTATQAVTPKLAVVFGRRSADTFAVMLEPSLLFRLQNPLHFELSAQVRSWKPARASANYLDEGERVTGEFIYEVNQLSIRQQFGVEVLNDLTSLTTQFSGELRRREWEFAAEALLRDLNSQLRSSWRVLAEVRWRVKDRAVYLRSFFLNSQSASATGATSVIEAGLSWGW